jgi:hypothetical protein
MKMTLREIDRQRNGFGQRLPAIKQLDLSATLLGKECEERERAA